MPTLRATRVPFLLGSLAAIALSVSGCGDDDDSGSEGTAGPDVAAVQATLVKHYKSPDCTDLTEKAQAQFGYGPGPDCETVIDERNPPKDVTVTGITVDGDQATGVVEGATFVLLRRGSGWIIDGTK